MANKRNLTRREFVSKTTRGALALGAGMALARPWARVLGANDRIRLGVIGPGGRGRALMRATKAIPGIELAALCDVYDENLKRAQELAGGTPQTFTDYRRLLDSKDLDGVIIGTPDHWHAPMIIDSVGAGKDIYCEKPMTHKLDEGPKIIEAVRASDRIVQIGMQQRSWDLFIRGREIVKSGHLGKIALVHTWWYQNAYRGTRRMDLKAPKPPGLDWDRWMGSAPKHDYEVARFRQWRHFRASGGGGLTDLLTHLIDVVQWYTGAATPASAMALGGNYQLKHWEWPETVTAALEYPEGFAVNYSQSYITRHEGHRITFRGTLATLEISRTELAVYEEGTRDIPSPLYQDEVMAANRRPVIQMKSIQDGTFPHMRNFVDCMRSRKEPNAPVTIGHQAVRGPHLANMSYLKGRKIGWDAVRNQPV